MYIFLGGVPLVLFALVSWLVVVGSGVFAGVVWEDVGVTRAMHTLLGGELLLFVS